MGGILDVLISNKVREVCSVSIRAIGCDNTWLDLWIYRNVCD